MHQVAETYAFLPREAVTKFLMSCADCQKRMHLTMDNYGTVQARLPTTVSCASYLIIVSCDTRLSSVHTVAEKCDCTVAEKWDCRRIRRQSHFCATISLFCDSVDTALWIWYTRNVYQKFAQVYSIKNFMQVRASFWHNAMLNHSHVWSMVC